MTVVKTSDFPQTTGNQIVMGSKTFLNGLTVRSNVLTEGYISNRDIRNVVPLESNDVINGMCYTFCIFVLKWWANLYTCFPFLGPLKFTNVVVSGDMRVSGRISDCDIQQWNENAFLTKSPQPQLVTGSWDVKACVPIYPHQVCWPNY